MSMNVFAVVLALAVMLVALVVQDAVMLASPVAMVAVPVEAAVGAPLAEENALLVAELVIIHAKEAVLLVQLALGLA